MAKDGGVFAFGDHALPQGPWAASPSTSRSWALPRPPTAGATGSWPGTAGCSPSAGRALLRVHGRHPPQPADRGHHGQPDDGRLLGSSERRWDLRLRRSVPQARGSLDLAAPGRRGAASLRSGGGYWEVAADGGLLPEGDAPFLGPFHGGPAVERAGAGNRGNPGRWRIQDGCVRRRDLQLGDAELDGSMGGAPLAAPIVGIAGAQ